ncbi:MAG: DUF1214 domain-containing protein, partial [Acidimicrobiia bacterium]
TAYDLETASYIRGVDRATIDSNMNDVEMNPDGSVDIWFGPTPLEGSEANWLRTDPDRRFFLIFRVYGPEPGIFDTDGFKLNDMEKL